MNVLRAVDGNADEKIVLGEEIRPLRCQERSIGLECVVDYLVLRIFLLELDGLPVEVETHDERLASVPVECDFGNVAGTEIVLDEFFKHILRHTGLPAAVQAGFVQVVTIPAVQIAERTAGLYHKIERQRTGHSLRIRQRYRILEEIFSHPGNYFSRRSLMALVCSSKPGFSSRANIFFL